MSPVRLPIAIGLWLVILLNAAAAQQAAPDCLSVGEQRNAVSSGRAMTLSKAICASRPRAQGEVIRAQLCRDGNGTLVYRLTLLARNGRVTRTAIDATNGAVTQER